MQIWPLQTFYSLHPRPLFIRLSNTGIETHLHPHLNCSEVCTVMNCLTNFWRISNEHITRIGLHNKKPPILWILTDIICTYTYFSHWLATPKVLYFKHYGKKVFWENKCFNHNCMQGSFMFDISWHNSDALEWLWLREGAILYIDVNRQRRHYRDSVDYYTHTRVNYPLYRYSFKESSSECLSTQHV